MALSANLGGWIADSLISKGVSVTTVRKVIQLENASIQKSNHILNISANDKIA